MPVWLDLLISAVSGGLLFLLLAGGIGVACVGLVKFEDMRGRRA